MSVPVEGAAAMPPDARAGRVATGGDSAHLSGALDTVALADVLQLLELGRKTGVLAVDGGDGRRGLVRLVHGAIAGARVQGGRPVDTLATAVEDEIARSVGALLGVRTGRFLFTPGLPGAARGPRLRVEAVLLAAFHAADEGAKPDDGAPVPSAAPAVTPSAASPEAVDLHVAVPRLAAPAAVAPSGGLRLRARHWAVLAAVDGVRTAAAVIAAVSAGGAARADLDRTDVDRADVDRTLQELCAAGVVILGPAPAAVDVPPGPARSSDG